GSASVPALWSALMSVVFPEPFGPATMTRSGARSVTGTAGSDRARRFRSPRAPSLARARPAPESSASTRPAGAAHGGSRAQGPPPGVFVRSRRRGEAARRNLRERREADAERRGFRRLGGRLHGEREA